MGLAQEATSFFYTASLLIFPPPRSNFVLRSTGGPRLKTFVKEEREGGRGGTFDKVQDGEEEIFFLSSEHCGLCSRFVVVVVIASPFLI